MIVIGGIFLVLNVLRMKGKKIRRRTNNMDKKKKYENMYKPKVMTQQDIDNSLKNAFSGQRRQQDKPKFNPPQMGQMYRPPTMKAKQQFQPKEQYPEPRARQPQPSMYRPPQRQEPEPQQEQPYWSGQDWEQWALDLYNSFEDARQFLPQWFIEAIEE